MKIFKKLVHRLGECADKLKATADRMEAASKQTVNKAEKDNVDAEAVSQILNSLSDNQMRILIEYFDR